MLAHGLRTERDLFFEQGFTAEGRGEIGAIGMNDARIGARLNIRGAHLYNPTGPALSLDGLHTTRDLHLDDGFTAEGAGAPGTIRLTGAHVGGTLHLTDATVTSRSAPEHRWALDGLVYAGVPRLNAKGNRAAWLELLRTGMPSYTAQPYQQLAAAYRAEGHDSDVRAILIAQRRDQIARGALSRTDLWWARLTGILLGYGYQPWRALLYLLGALAISVTVTVVLGTAGGLAQTPAGSAAAPPCAVIDMSAGDSTWAHHSCPKPPRQRVSPPGRRPGWCSRSPAGSCNLPPGRWPPCSSRASPESSARPEPSPQRRRRWPAERHRVAGLH